MNDEDRLNPNHTTMRRWLRVAGPAMIVAGLLFSAVGLTSFFMAFNSFGPPRYFWCAFIGLPLVAVGIGLTKFAFMGDIFRYMSAEAAPVGKDTFNYLAANMRDGVRDISSAVSQGFSDSSIRCSACGNASDPTAKFCDECGQPLIQRLRCLNCSELNESGAKFCNACGRQLS